MTESTGSRLWLGIVLGFVCEAEKRSKSLHILAAGFWASLGLLTVLPL